MNKLFFEGRLTKPAEVKTSQSGNEYATLNLSQSKKNKNGEFESIFVRASCFKFNVKKVSELQKGDRVLVSGPISMDTYQDKQGQTRYSLNMLVEDVLPLAPRPAYEAGNTREIAQSIEDFAQQFAAAPAQNMWEGAALNEEIPF
jgi:single-strand DNA-binding protein